MKAVAVELEKERESAKVQVEGLDLVVRVPLVVLLEWLLLGLVLLPVVGRKVLLRQHGAMPLSKFWSKLCVCLLQLHLMTQ